MNHFSSSFSIEAILRNNHETAGNRSAHSEDGRQLRNPMSFVTVELDKEAHYNYNSSMYTAAHNPHWPNPYPYYALPADMSSTCMAQLQKTSRRKDCSTGISQRVSSAEKYRMPVCRHCGKDPSLLQGECKMPRKRKKRFSCSEILQLQAEFAKKPYPTPGEYKELSKEIGVTAREVQVWFQHYYESDHLIHNAVVLQNKRFRDKRSAVDSEPASYNDVDYFGQFSRDPEVRLDKSVGHCVEMPRTHEERPQDHVHNQAYISRVCAPVWFPRPYRDHNI